MKPSIESRLFLLRNATLFTPEHRGNCDLFIAGGQLIAMTPRLTAPTNLPVEILDLQGAWVIPGLIDSHIHIAGAGGEGGPASRTEGVEIHDLITGGITSVVGCLGTDGFTRSIESVLMKAKSLNDQGISAWIYTGSYQIPTPTLTGSISRDIALFSEIIGVGEIALADHRSSYPTFKEFITVLQQARLGGLIGGKSGLVNIHIGDYGHPFAYLEKALTLPGIHAGQMLPTHCNRSRDVFEQAKQYARKGYIDLTTSSFPAFQDCEIKPSAAWLELMESGISHAAVTLSSDAGGSLPRFDDQGHCIGSTVGRADSMLSELRDMIAQDPHDRDRAARAIATVTSNVADRLGLAHRGRLQTGAPADLVVLNEDFSARLVLADGRIMMRDDAPSAMPTRSPLKNKRR